MGERKRFEIFDAKYEVTRKIKIDLVTGRYRLEEDSKDEELIDRILKKHKLKDNTMIIYTDSSKKKEGKATGASIVIEDQEVAYKISMNKACSSFTAETFAIKSALELLEKEAKDRSEDVIILTDSKSTLQAIKNNHLNVYKNKYIMEIRKRHLQLEKKYNKKLSIYGYRHT